jgi:MATE family multidrug resistance protein
MDPYSHRQVARIAAPLIVSNATVPLLGAVDTAVMGHLDSPDFLASVAVGSTVFSILYLGFNFLRMGTTGLAAQAFGRAQNAEIRTVLAQGLLTAGALGLVLILVQSWLGSVGLGLIGAEGFVGKLARTYFDIRIWSAPATLCNFVLLGWFIGMQNGRAPLVMLLVTTGVNTLLDLLLVLGMGMQTDGVALASALAEYTGLLCGLALIRPILRDNPGSWQPPQIFSLSRFRKLVSVNANLLLRTLSLMFTFAFITAQGMRMGPAILAANAVLMNFQHITAYLLDGLANAAEALVGRAIGEGSQSGLDRAVKVSLQWSLVVALGFSVLYLATGGHLIRVLTGLPEIRGLAMDYLPWMILSPLVSVWSFLFDGVYVGATRAREMRNTMLFSTLAVFLPAWFVFRGLHNHGLWLAFTLFMAARGLSMAWLYHRMARDGALLKPENS